jgi:hypothetical protein
MPEKKKESQKNPTPLLNLPRRDRKSFTYSENQLLDQITTEVMEAWKKDLALIKRTNQEFTEKAAIIYQFCEKLSFFLPLMHDLMTGSDYQEWKDSCDQNNREINTRITQINLTLFDIQEIVKELRSMKQEYDDLKKKKCNEKGLGTDPTERPYWRDFGKNLRKFLNKFKTEKKDENKMA